MKQLEVARRAAQIGGEIIMRYFREGVAMRSKQEQNAKSYDLVSDADVQSEQAIVAMIRDEFPNDEMMGEESHQGDAGADRLWIIDPLDGTNNFAHNIPHFAVSIGYYEAGQPVCGVIYNPARDDWYEATRGGGATYNGQPVRVAENERLDEVLIGVGFYYDRGAMMEATLLAIRDLFHQNIHGIRRFGTAALDLVHVGMGLYGACFEYELSPWDFAAGRLFVEEAGGKVTTCSGAVLPLTKSSVLASNNHLHDAVQKIVEVHLPKP